MSLHQFFARRAVVSSSTQTVACRPVPLQAALLKAVSGGGPRGTWSVSTDTVAQGPRGSW